MMKKLALILAAILAVSCFSACAATGDPADTTAATTAEDTTLPVVPVTPDKPELSDVGAVNFDGVIAGTLPANAKAAFDKAVSMIDGVAYTPLACIGEQAVEGTNYAILCLTEPTVYADKPKPKLSVAFIYAPPFGVAELKDIVDFNISDYRRAAPSEEETPVLPALGGYIAPHDGSCELTGNAKTAFEGAFEGIAGVSREPLAFIGTQVVAGTNYYFITRNAAMTVDPVYGIYLVTINVIGSKSTCLSENLIDISAIKNAD